MNNISLKEIYSEIKKAKDILIITHQRPDGDAIDSMLALSTIIERENIPVDCLVTDLPKYLEEIPGTEKIKKEINREYDLVIIVDTGVRNQLGVFEELYDSENLIIMDHHNIVVDDKIKHYVDDDASSATSVIYDFVIENNIKLDLCIAEYIYIGLLTDTGGFAHNNTTSEALLLGSKLLKYGINHNKLYMKFIRKEYDLNYLALNKIAIENLELIDNAIAFSFIDYESLEKYPHDTPKEFVNVGKSIKGVEVSILIVEESPGAYRVNLRSRSYLDVSEVARSLGGGGHVNASGIRFKSDYNEFKEKLLGEVKRNIR